MCYSIPAKIISIKCDEAEVDYGGVTKKVNISLIDKAKIGEYILVHAGFGIEKIETKSAEESLQIIRTQMNETEKFISRQKA